MLRKLYRITVEGKVVEEFLYHDVRTTPVKIVLVRDGRTLIDRTATDGDVHAEAVRFTHLEGVDGVARLGIFLHLPPDGHRLSAGLLYSCVCSVLGEIATTSWLLDYRNDEIETIRIEQRTGDGSAGFVIATHGGGRLIGRFESGKFG